MIKLVAAAALGAAVTLAAGPAYAQKSRDTLRWASEKVIPVVDPYYTALREMNVITAQLVWDTLIYRDPKTGEYKPLLAERWRWVDDVTLEFDLRRDVKFHDGGAFNADDVVYTVNYVVDPESKIHVPSNFDWMKSAERLDDFKVRIHLKQPFAPALEYLSNTLEILPKDFYGTTKAAGANGRLVGTGPYRITKWEPGKTVELTRYQNHIKDSPKGQPAIGNIHYKMIPEPTARIAELLAGSVDWIWYVAPDQGAKLAQMKHLTVVPEVTMRVAYLAFETTGRAQKNPFQDVRVRRAAWHAINRESLARDLVGPGSELVPSACYKSQFGCLQDTPQYEYSPEKARQLLAEAGYPNGFDIDYIGYSYRRETEAVMGDLIKSGIRAKLTFLNYATARERWQKGLAPVFFGGWGSYSINDVSALLNTHLMDTADDNAKDPDLHKWLKEAAGSTNPARRQELYAQALRRINEQAYWVPLYAVPITYAYTSDLVVPAWPDENPRFFLARWK